MLVSGLLGVAGLLGIRGPRRTAVVVVRGRRRVAPSRWRTVLRGAAVTGRRRSVALLVSGGTVSGGAVSGGAVSGGAVAGGAVAGGAVTGGAGTLLVALIGVTALLWIAVAGRVALLVGGGIALLGLVRRPLRFRCDTPRILLGLPVLIAVVLVAGASLALATAVLVVGHRWHSSFCGVRMVRYCWGGWATGWAEAGVGVDDGSGTVLAGVQALGLLEAEHHLTIGLPSLFMNISRQVPREGVCRQFPVGIDVSEIGQAEGNDVVIGDQEPLTGQDLHSVVGFSAQHRFHFLRNDRAAEHPGEGVAHAVFESAFDALNQAPLVAHHTALTRSADRPCGKAAGVAEAVIVSALAGREMTTSRRWPRCRSSKHFIRGIYPACRPNRGVGLRHRHRAKLPRLFWASGGMADALASGASVLRDVGVQVPLRPHTYPRVGPLRRRLGSGTLSVETFANPALPGVK